MIGKESEENVIESSIKSIESSHRNSTSSDKLTSQQDEYYVTFVTEEN